MLAHTKKNGIDESNIDDDDSHTESPSDKTQNKYSDIQKVDRGSTKESTT